MSTLSTTGFAAVDYARWNGLGWLVLLLLMLVGGGIIAAYGYSLQDSLFEFASALGSVGITVGVTTPDAAAGVLWVEMAGMVLGRLEFFTVVVGLIRLAGDLPVLLLPARTR